MQSNLPRKCYVSIKSAPIIGRVVARVNGSGEMVRRADGMLDRSHLHRSPHRTARWT